MIEDAELLRRFAREGAEEAFGEIVRRHVDLVYSAALRQVGGDAHRAKDVAQEVFSDLARKAGVLAGRPVLAGWLFTATRFAAAKMVRAEQRRHAREQEVATMNAMLDEGEEQAEWDRLRPVIDEAMSALKEGDREAVLLRFFENRGLAEVGAKLGLSENAARMRVERALEKLRAVLARRGVTSTSAALGVVLTNQAVIAAPVGTAGMVLSSALAGATAAVSGAGAVFSFMSITQAKAVLSVVVIGAAALGIAWQQHTNAKQAARLREQAARYDHAVNELAALQQKKTGMDTEAEALRKRISVNAEPIAANHNELNDPEFVRIFSLARRVEESPRLIRRLGLSASEAEVMIDLLVERRLAVERATQVVTREAKDMVTVDGRGMTRGVALLQDATFNRRLQEVATRGAENKIHAFLGEARYDVYLTHRTPVFTETFSDVLEQRGVPLSDAQLDRLQELKRGNGGSLWSKETEAKDRGGALSATVVDDVKNVLSPVQWDLLRTLEERGQAEYALQERNRAAAMGGKLKLLPSSEAVYRDLRKANAETSTP